MKRQWAPLWQSATMSVQARKALIFGEVDLFQSGVRRFRQDAGSVAGHVGLSGDLDSVFGGQVERDSCSARTRKYR